jgi:hypothetical protein
MTATKAPEVPIESVTDVTAGLVRITELPGGELPLEDCRWAEPQRSANFHFWTILGELTGRLEPSAGFCLTQKGSPETWLRLADVDAEALQGAVGRMRRQYPEWMFDTGRAPANGIHEQIDAHFATAQVRRRREG